MKIAVLSLFYQMEIAVLPKGCRRFPEQKSLFYRSVVAVFPNNISVTETLHKLK